MSSKNLATIFGKAYRQAPGSTPPVNWVLPHQLVGLEIEVEATPNCIMPTNYFPYWNRIKDGSLRNGSEFVLAMPLKGDILAQAIHELYSTSKFERSTTGSTHIHLDMFEEKVSHDIVKVMVMLMYVFEGAIFAIADRGREWCGYTNKLTSAPENLVGAVLNASDADNFEEFRIMCASEHSVGRYYGINVMALQKYGSLEFRYFPTATNPGELIDWVNLCMQFKLAALQLGTVDRLMEVLSDEEQYDNFLTMYFAQWKDAFMQELTHLTALSNAQKALAVASTQALQRQPMPPWDEKSVTSNKLLAKFVKNKVKETFDIIISGPYTDAPMANEKKIGTPMIHAERVYLATGYDWISAPFDAHADRLTDAIKRRSLKTLIKVWPQLNHKLQGLGHGTGARSRAISRVQQAIGFISASLGENMPELPQQEPIDEIAMTPPTPQLFRTAPQVDWGAAPQQTVEAVDLSGPALTEDEINALMEEHPEVTEDSYEPEEGSDE